MTTTTASAPTAPVRRTFLAKAPVWLVGAAAGALAAAVLFGYGAAAKALGTPMRVGEIGSHSASPLAPANFSIGVAVSVFWGTLLAVALARWAARPARAFLYSALGLTLLSLVSPLGAAHTAWSTKITLVCGHLLAASIVIPLLTRRLARTRRSSRTPA